MLNSYEIWINAGFYKESRKNTESREKLQIIERDDLETI